MYLPGRRNGTASGNTQRHVQLPHWIKGFGGESIPARILLAHNCRGGRMADAKGWLKRGGGSRVLVGFGGEVHMHGRGTPDIPRFGALRRDNTPSPAECSWMIDSTMLLLELYEGGRKLAKAWAAPSLRCCCFVASPPASPPNDRGLPGVL